MKTNETIKWQEEQALQRYQMIAPLLDESLDNAKRMFFVKYFSLKKASEFPFFSKGFSLPSAGIMHPCA